MCVFLSHLVLRGVDVEFNCINSLSLPFYLLWMRLQNPQVSLLDEQLRFYFTHTVTKMSVDFTVK